MPSPVSTSRARRRGRALSSSGSIGSHMSLRRTTKRHVAAARGGPAAVDPVLQSAAVTGSVTSPPHEAAPAAVDPAIAPGPERDQNRTFCANPCQEV
jgi:hypothetical protein